MSSFLAAAGQMMHLIRVSASGIIGSSPSAASGFPAANAANGIPSCPMKFGSVSAASYSIDADLNLAKNGDFESWDDPSTPTGWTLEGNTAATQKTTDPIQGVSTLQLAGQVYRDYHVPSGALCAFRLRMYAENGASPAKVEIIDLETGEFLLPDGTWSTTDTSLFEEDDTTAPRTKGIVFQTRPYSTVQKDLTTLRVRLLCGTEAGANEGFFDDLSLVVVPNFSSVHGHNIPVNKLPHSIRSSPDSSFTARPYLGTSQGGTYLVTRDELAYSTPNQPSFYYWLKDNCPLFENAGTLELTSGVSARGDSEKVTVSLWIRPNGDDVTSGDRTVLKALGTSTVLELRLQASNRIRFILFDSGATQIVNVVSTAEAMPPDTDWHHILFSVDTTTGTVRAQLYVDDADVKDGGSSSITTDGVIDFSAVTKIVLGGDEGSPELSAALNEVYVQPDFSEDISVSGNREKFRTTTGDRANIGADGSTPSGGQAWIYMVGTQASPVTDFADNKGDAGPFVLNGSIGSECMWASQRYWRLMLYHSFSQVAAQEAAPEKIHIGEWVLTRVAKLLQRQRWEQPQPRSRPAVELVSPSAQRFRAPLSYADTHSYGFRFYMESAAQRQQWLELRDRCGGGTEPVVIVPRSDKPEVEFGHIALDFPDEHVVLEQSQVSVDFHGAPLAHE